MRRGDPPVVRRQVRRGNALHVRPPLLQDGGGARAPAATATHPVDHVGAAAAVAPLLVADVAVRVGPRHVGRPRRRRCDGGDGVEAVDVLRALVEAAPAGRGAEERDLVLDRLHAVLVVAEAVVRLFEARGRARR